MLQKGDKNTLECSVMMSNHLLLWNSEKYSLFSDCLYKGVCILPFLQFIDSDILLPLAVSLQNQFPAIWQQSLFCVLGYRIFRRSKAISPGYLQGAMGWAAKNEARVGAVLRKEKSSRDLSQSRLWLSGWLGIWGRKSEVDQVAGKESGIKDFWSWTYSCPLIDLFACFLGITVSKSGLYCQPLEVSQESCPHARVLLEWGPGGAHILGCSSFCIYRNSLDGLGFSSPRADTFSSRDSSSWLFCSHRIFRREV